MLNLIILIFLTLTATSSDELLSLIKAEKSFSALSSLKGIRTAFLTYFDEDAIVFAPKPVKGRKLYQESDSIPGLLQWEPQFADISYSGNLGYTTGPWKRDNNSKISFGHFVSVWEKKAKGWKVILDTGINYEESYKPITEVNTSLSLNHEIYSNGKTVEKELSILNKELNSAVQYKHHLSEDIILLRPGKHPVIGVAAVLNYLNQNTSPSLVEQEFQKISDAGDLAYSYGYFTFDNNNQECYLRIWKRSDKGEWKLALELVKPAK